MNTILWVLFYLLIKTQKQLFFLLQLGKWLATPFWMKWKHFGSRPESLENTSDIHYPSGGEPVESICEKREAKLGRWLDLTDWRNVKKSLLCCCFLLNFFKWQNKSRSDNTSATAASTLTALAAAEHTVASSVFLFWCFSRAACNGAFVRKLTGFKKIKTCWNDFEIQRCGCLARWGKGCQEGKKKKVRIW